MDGCEMSRPMRGERYMRSCAVGASSLDKLAEGMRTRRMVERRDSDGGGKTDMSFSQMSETRSAIFDALLRRRISSTKREGPEITLASLARRTERKRIPPRRIRVPSA